MFVDTSSRLKIGIDLTFIGLNFVRGEENIRISFIFETVTLNILREEIKTLFFFYNLQFVENVSKIKLHSKSIIFYESSRLSGKEPSIIAKNPGKLLSATNSSRLVEGGKGIGKSFGQRSPIMIPKIFSP